MANVREPIATRTLAWHDGDDMREVVVRVWAPVPEGDNYVCDFAIDGLPEPVRSSAGGVDSLQALIVAFAGLRAMLEPHSPSLSWLDDRGEHGIPQQIVSALSVDRRRLEHLVAAENQAINARLREPHERKMAELRELYDPGARELTSGKWSTGELVAELMTTSSRMREARERQDPQAERFFGRKRWSIVELLRAEPDFEDVLIELGDSGDRSLRLLSALLTGPSALTKLIAIRDEGVEPEASEAARILEGIEQRDRRPKAWDPT
jgi:hypothetical protein